MCCGARKHLLTSCPVSPPVPRFAGAGGCHCHCLEEDRVGFMQGCCPYSSAGYAALATPNCPTQPRLTYAATPQRPSARMDADKTKARDDYQGRFGAAHDATRPWWVFRSNRGSPKSLGSSHVGTYQSSVRGPLKGWPPTPRTCVHHAAHFPSTPAPFRVYRTRRARVLLEGAAQVKQIIKAYMRNYQRGK